ERIKLEAQEALAKRQEAERVEKEKQDAIAKAVEEERLRLEAQALAKKQEAERLEKAQQDAIAKVKEEERIKLEAQQALAKRQEAERVEKEKQDSIANVKDEEQKKPALKKTKKNAIIEENEEKERLENIEFRNTCHYAMNEYDAIDRIKIVRTDPYKINDDLTVELFKRGSSTNVFFNLKADLGCASYLPSNRSSVKVKLENNQTITFYHSWGMDCGNFAFKAILSRSQMALLKNAPIKSILLRGTKNSREVTNIEYKAFFMDKLSCIE
uniref:hypothetical protein n=3 Tax=Mariniflexile sp. TaxID=1979402 RepID=UPI004047B75D